MVIARRVPARVAPKTTSELIEHVSCEVVRVGGSGLSEEPSLAAPGWTAVFLTSGRWAYIENRYLGDPYGTYIEIEKRNGRWLLASFAGVD